MKQGSYEITVGKEKIKVCFEYANLEDLIQTLKELRKFIES